MPKQYRIAIIGLIHDHVWSELKRALALDNVKIVAAADPNPPLLERVRERAGLNEDRLYTDYNKLLVEHGKEIDIVLCYTDNAHHAPIVEACAPYGINVLMEKPMAATLAQARRIMAAAKQHGIKLLVNWPNNWNPALQHAIKLANDGEIGTLYEVRYRSAHSGPKEINCDPYFVQWLYDEELNGAGAYMDYCCYGASLCRLMLGMPQRVSSIRAKLTKDYDIVDDNGVVLMEYPNAFGIAEGSWSLIGADPIKYVPIFYGKTGTMIVQQGKLQLYKAGVSEKEPETISAPALPAGQSNAIEYFITCLDQNKPVEGLCSPEIALDAQEILEAGLRAADTHTVVSLPLEK